MVCPFLPLQNHTCYFKKKKNEFQKPFGSCKAEWGELVNWDTSTSTTDWNSNYKRDCFLGCWSKDV